MTRPLLTASPLALALVLLAGAQAGAQEGASTPLERARQTFAVADADRNGLLDAAELAKASIRPADARKWDADGSGGLSGEEFLGYYRQLVIDAGRSPGSELEREVRRAAKARGEEVDERVGVVPPKRPGDSPVRSDWTPAPATAATTADKYRRARAALDERLTRAGSRTRSDLGTRQGSASAARRAERGLEDPTVRPPAGGTVQPSSAIRERLNRIRTPGPGKVETREGAGAEAPTPERPRPAAGEDAPTQLTPEERARLQRSFDVLEARARSAGWSTEQLEGLKRQLVERLRESGKRGKRGAEQLEGKQGASREQRTPAGVGPKGGAKRSETSGSTERPRAGSRGSGRGGGGGGPRY